MGTTNLDALSVLSPTVTTFRIAKAAMEASTGDNGGALQWANPEGAPIMIWALALDITTGTSGVATINAGVAATGAATSDTLIDGAATSGVAVIDSFINAGTNGVGPQKATATQYVTATHSGATAAFAGNAYIVYSLVS